MEIYITKLHNNNIIFENFESTKLTYMYIYIYIYIDYVEKIILEFVQVVCDLFKLKHIYIFPILNLRP